MASRPTVGAHVTPCPDTVDFDAPLIEARRFMQHRHIRHPLVVEADRLIGLLTHRDIKLMPGPDFDYPPPGKLYLRHAFADEPYIGDYDCPLEEIAAETSKRRVGSALVTRGGNLAGILTVTGALRELSKYLG